MACTPQKQEVPEALEPTIALSENQVDITMGECLAVHSEELEAKWIYISNEGDGDLGTIQLEVDYQNTEQEWLSLELLGTNTIELKVRPEVLADMDTQDYKASVRAYSSTAINSFASFDVHLNMLSFSDQSHVKIKFHVENGNPEGERIYWAYSVTRPAAGGLAQTSTFDNVPLEGIKDGDQKYLKCTMTGTYQFTFATDNCNLDIPNSDDLHFELEEGETELIHVYLNC